MKYSLAFAIAFIIVVCLTPILIKISRVIGFIDRPTERKAHKMPTPLCGGIAIFISFFITYSLFIKEFDIKYFYIIVSSLMILSIGLLDDWYKANGRELQALPKFLIQISAAVMIYKCGIVFHGFNNPITDKFVLLPNWIQFVFTIIWIFGVTTVINFIDGLDGLAGGIVSISASTLFVVSLIKNQTASSFMSIILVGAALGFLKYNKAPAKAFLGDSGATFLGFILGIISLDGAFKHATVISVFVPILALGVPILDNIYVVIKRIIDKKPVYKADRSQIHYRLLESGLNPKYATLFLYLISLCFSLTSIIILLIEV